MIPPDGPDGHDENGDDLIAAEFVVGALPLEERRQVETRIASEPAFAERVRAWEERLAPMAETIAPVTPPAHVYSGIEERLFATAAHDRQPRLWTSLGFWRGLAFASLAAFLVMAGAIAFYQIRPQPVEQPLVAALDAKGSNVKIIAYYDMARRRLVIQPVSGAPAANRDFELWFIKGKKAAVSLGVLPKGGKSADLTIKPALAAQFAGGATLAITDEPLGGSPTGVATGPVVAIGQLRAI